MTARLLWIESEKYIVLHGNKVCLFMFVVHVPFWGICNSFHWNRYSRQPAFFLFCSFLFAWNLCRGAPWRKLYANEYCMRREEMKCARREKERERVRAVKRRTLATGCPGNEGAEKVKTGFGIHKSCVLPAHSHSFSNSKWFRCKPFLLLCIVVVTVYNSKLFRFTLWGRLIVKNMCFFFFFSILLHYGLMCVSMKCCMTWWIMGWIGCLITEA